MQGSEGTWYKGGPLGKPLYWVDARGVIYHYRFTKRDTEQNLVVSLYNDTEPNHFLTRINTDLQLVPDDDITEEMRLATREIVPIDQGF